MKLKIDISEEMEDAIVLASLKQNLKWQINYKPIHEQDEKENNEYVMALQKVLEYYGGKL